MKSANISKKKINPNQIWFKSLKEAKQACSERFLVEVYKQKAGRHRGQYFVGTYFEFINKY